MEVRQANSRFGVALRACGLTLASLPTGRQLFFFLFGGGKIFKGGLPAFPRQTARDSSAPRFQRGTPHAPPTQAVSVLGLHPPSLHSGVFRYLRSEPASPYMVSIL